MLQKTVVYPAPHVASDCGGQIFRRLAALIFAFPSDFRRITWIG